MESKLPETLRNSLEQSSKKIAIEIATKTKELQSIQKKLSDHQEQFTILQARIEVHQENQDKIHEDLRKRKLEKNGYFQKRDDLIAQKRVLQMELRDSGYSQSNQSLNDRITKLSDEINQVIETSKSLSAKMQEMYETAQDENKKMNDRIDELNQLKYESRNIVSAYEREIASIENELLQLRRKMKDIKEKLGK